MDNRQANSSVANASVDTELGRLVVEQNLATPDEVRECIDLKRQGSDPAQRTLADVLIAQGIVTARQMSRLKRTIESARSDQQLPGYEILGKLGAGAMATVWRARQVNLDRTVAVKILPKRLSENPDYVARFYKEGKAAAQLNHANIVQAIDVGESNGYHYFVMEFVEGHTVYDELDQGKIFSEAEALDVIAQIARALKHAHDRGFIHRDVKPKNIMITPDRVAKLTDMGLAREASDLQAAQAEKGRAFGTPYYISPEQIRGEVDVDFRADIYSLGATFYHMVTGRVPFDGPTPAAVMHKHLKEPLVPPDHLNRSLSAGVGEVIEVMMAKRRDHRYASTADLLVDLEAVRRGEPPPQARSRIGGDVLNGLAQGLEDPRSLETVEVRSPVGDHTMIYLILLGGALALSLLLNLVQLLS